jgi:uncharacterized damage-inducible protein DinB
MVLKTLNTLFQRDLAQLATEIDAYRNESNLWVVDKEIANCAGNLCLHLVGNLNAYIGATLGGSGYIRHRELEFSEKNVPKTELLRRIKETAAILDKTLETLKEEDMNKEFPLIVFKEKMTTGFFLIHLATHLSYHLGQINYHRRLLDF